METRYDSLLNKSSSEKSTKKKIIGILGLSFSSEIKLFEEFKNLENINFFLLDQVLEKGKTIEKRNATQEVIEDLNQLKKLRIEFMNKKENIINTDNLSAKEILVQLSKLIS